MPVVVKLVLFDIDGTLIRTGGAGVKAFEETFLKVFGIPEATKTLKFAGRTDTSLVREGFVLHGIEPTQENFAKFFNTYPLLLESLLQRLPGGVCEGVEPFLGALYKVTPKPAIGLLTGNVRRGAELKLRHYGLWQHFPFGGFGDDHEERHCIASAAKERGEKIVGRALRGEEILVIGDTPLDVLCAKSIQAKVIGVATGNYTVEELQRSEPTWSVKNLAELDVETVLNGAVR
jgi:phosphoglycolate phosphatase